MGVDEAARKVSPTYLRLYDQQYFEGREQVSSYANYADCRDILHLWAGMLDRRFRPKQVLDVGAAYGFVVDWFDRMGVSAVGVEPSEFALARAVTPHVRHGWLPDHLPVAHAQYDLVTCTECLEHVPTADVPASLTALRDAAAPGGQVVLLIMLADHPTAHDDAGHLTLESRAWWEEQLDRTGLTPNRAAEQYLNEHPTSEHMKWSGRIFVRTRT